MGASPNLTDLQTVQQDFERIARLSDELGLDFNQLQLALTLRTIRELTQIEGDIEDLQQVGGRAPVSRTLPPTPGVLKAFEINEQVTAGQDVLSDDFEIDANFAVLRTTVAIDSGGTAQVFSVSLNDGRSDVVVDFNQGNTLDAGSVFAFDLPVSGDVTVNYRLGGDETLAILVAQEIDTAGP